MDESTDGQYATEYEGGGEWYQYVASPDKAEIPWLGRHLQAMKVQKPIRLVGFDVLRSSAAATA